MNDSNSNESLYNFSTPNAIEVNSLEESREVLRNWAVEVDSLTPRLEGISLRSGKKLARPDLRKTLHKKKLTFQDSSEASGSKMSNPVTTEMLDTALKSFGEQLLKQFLEQQQATTSKEAMKQNKTKEKDDDEEYQTSNEDDVSGIEDLEKSGNEEEEGGRKENQKKSKKRSINAHLARTRQNALMVATNIKEYKQETYKEFLMEIENVVRIYKMDNESVQIILDTASLKINNPLVKGRKFNNFKELKKAVTDIAATEMDYRTYTNKIARAAQASDQTVEQFGASMAQLLQEQSAAYRRNKEDKMEATEIQKELEEMSQIAAQNFMDGISMKFKEVKARLRLKTHTSLASAIVEAKMIGKSIDEEKSRAFAQRSEEFRLKKTEKRPDQKFNRNKNGLNKKFGNKEWVKDKPKEAALGQGGGGKPAKTPFKCYNCDKIGHKASDCRSQRKKFEKPVKNETENIPTSTVLTIEAKNLGGPAVSQPVSAQIVAQK